MLYIKKVKTELNKKNELDEVISLLKDVDSNASPGISGLPIIILKQASNYIAEPLKQIFNSSINQNVFIKEWNEFVQALLITIYV